jgi:BirA family biotin operon repressor/biotin-[acetyl-CoA-carboxylase] ligase
MGLPFDLARIRSATFVDRIEYYDELPSTNDLALERARKADQVMPLLVLTARQTRGRGRGTNRWWSADGALTFSLVVKVETAEHIAERLPQVSLIAAVAVCQSIATCVPATNLVRVKWPNDVYLDHRKICGILIEVPAQPPGRMVVGMGVNVNNSLAEAPDELRRRAISLRDATGRVTDLSDFLILIFQHFETGLRALEEGHLRLGPLCQPWCGLRGGNVSVVFGHRRIAGLCQGIDDDGSLVIQTAAGPQRCFSGVVESVDWAEPPETDF